MNTNTKSLLPLLIVIISISTGIALGNGENVTNATLSNLTKTNVTNVIIESNVKNIVAQNVTAEPSVTMSMAKIATANIASDSNVTIIPIVTTPVVTVSIPEQVATPNVSVMPTVTVTQPVAEQNITIVYVPAKDKNTSQPQISDETSGTHNTRKQEHTSKQLPIIIMPVVTTEVPANANQNGFLGDIYSKIAAGAILGFFGLCYEIIKIKYDHKQKSKLEKISEDKQNKLLEKFERKQEEILSRQKNSDEHKNIISVNETQQENINDKDKNV